MANAFIILSAGMIFFLGFIAGSNHELNRRDK